VATNFYFNNFSNSQEQSLVEDLVTESIKIYGHDVYFLPRTIVARDSLYNQDDLSRFDSAYLVEMYIKNVEGFEGEGDLFSRFGVEIRDQITFVISQRTFDNEIGTSVTLTRPREGDIIFFPLNNKAFQIKFVEHEAVFYQMGALQTYEMSCELFEYSGEQFNTGIDIIDKIEEDNAPARSLYLTAVAGNFQKGEVIREDLGSSQYLKGNILGITANNDASNAFTLEVGSIRSDLANTIHFSANATLTGVTSGATGVLTTLIDELANDTLDQNVYFETQGDNILDFTDQDPFSQGGNF